MMLLLVPVLFATMAMCFTFDLEARQWRCFTEELPSNLEVSMTFSAAPGYAQFIDVKITDPMNEVIWSEEGVDKSSWKTTTRHGGDYAFCFYSRMVPGVRPTEGMKRTLSFNLKTGSDTHNYDQLATVEHMKPLEVSLRIMEDTIRGIHAEYTYYKDREREMRDTNEHINARVMWLTVLVIGLVVAFAFWQTRHLKTYFRRKRVID
jgi:hypothetical protein